MKIKPIFTEKSVNQAKSGTYSFWMHPSLSKYQIKNILQVSYDVVVKSVRTLSYKKMISKNSRGRVVTIPAKKKALITLKSGKLDIFDDKSDSAKKTKKKKQK